MSTKQELEAQVEELKHAIEWRDGTINSLRERLDVYYARVQEVHNARNRALRELTETRESASKTISGLLEESLKMAADFTRQHNRDIETLASEARVGMENARAETFREAFQYLADRLAERK